MMWHRGYTPARYYTIAWTALLVGTLVFVLAKLGFIARTLFTENGMQAGSTIEVILLSFALANRINVARREKELAQAETVSILQKYRTLYENAIEGIFQTTLDYAFSNANRAMTRMLGLNSKQALYRLRR
jgi:two-component system, sensor histidine kinase LadS